MQAMYLWLYISVDTVSLCDAIIGQYMASFIVAPVMAYTGRY